MELFMESKEAADLRVELANTNREVEGHGGKLKRLEAGLKVNTDRLVGTPDHTGIETRLTVLEVSQTNKTAGIATVISIAAVVISALIGLFSLYQAG